MGPIFSDFWRLATRHRLYTALNVIGLALGIATFLTLALVARYELSWDRFYPHASSIYELQGDVLIGSGTFHMTGQPSPLLPVIQARFPGLKATRSENGSVDVENPSDPNKTVHHDVGINFVDPNFFEIFDLKFSFGSAAALSSPDNIVLSAEMARNGRTHVYRIAGILKPHPSNTTISMDLVAPISSAVAERLCDDWTTLCARSYAILPTRTERTTFMRLARDMFGSSPMGKQMGKDANGEKMDLHLVPLTDNHFGPDGTADDGASRDVVLALAGVGLLSLVAGALNYVNLATAQSLGRAREVAIRKVLGASRARLTMRFLGEAFVLTLLAGLLGLALAEMAVPTVASLSAWPVTLDYAWTLPLLLAVVLVLTMGAGFYPAFLLSSFAPAPVLASARLPAQGRFGARIRLFLVGLQFAFAVVLGICTLVVSRDAARKLGFSSPQAAIGQTFLLGDKGPDDRRTIVGVVDDVILNSGQDTLPPVIYELESGPIAQGVITLRAAPDALPRVLSSLRAAWPKLAPNVPFEPQAMTEIIADATRGDVARGELFAIGAGVAIACLGLYGLAAFNAERRMHEVGIRKTLGATTGQIMRLMLLQFLRPVFYASLVSWPLAWMFMRGWLAGFDNRIALTPFYFVLTTLLAALFCALTVFGRTIGLARAEPARALRAE